MQRAFETVDAVVRSGLGRTYSYKLPVTLKNIPAIGTVVPRKGTRIPERIDFRVNSSLLEIGAAHEAWHVLDKVFTANIGFSNSKQFDSLLLGVRTAIRNSEAYQELQKVPARAQATIQGRAQFNQAYFNYAVSDAELLARAFAQYVSRKSAEPMMQLQIDKMRHPAQLYKDMHWDDDDFAAIEAEFDVLFQKLGALTKE